MLRLDRSKVVVVTGASAGVGRATVREFAKYGVRLGLMARGKERLEDTAREVEAMGCPVVAVPTDVADFDQVARAAEEIQEQLGPIDVWVNDAMSTVFAPVHEIQPQEFRRATEVTYLGTVHGTMCALRSMRPRNQGVIVQVGSALAYRGIPLQAPYCGAKHAIRGFTDSLRCELLHEQSGIHLTAVHLPALNTPQFEWCLSRLPRHPQPVPPIFQPEVAARAIVFAATHRRREVLVGLPTVKTVWGNKLFPAYADRFLARTAYEGQQTAEAVNSDRPSNLFEPVAANFAAHGTFDGRAKEYSEQSWLTRHRGFVSTAVLGLVCGGMLRWISQSGR